MTDHLETLRQFVHEIETAPTKVYPTMRLDRLEHVVAALASVLLDLTTPQSVAAPAWVPPPKSEATKPEPRQGQAMPPKPQRPWFKGKDG